MRSIAHYMARTARAARADARRGPSTEQELIEIAAMGRARRARQDAAAAAREAKQRDAETRPAQQSGARPRLGVVDPG